jgi:phosphoglycerol transferase MdoB-like AlkP superfamily enzyme
MSIYEEALMRCKEKSTLPNLSEFAVWLRALVIMIGMLIAARISLLALYPSYFDALTAADIAHSFAVGLRFDLATSLLTISLPLLPLWIPWSQKWERTALKMSQWMTAICVLTAAVFLWSDVLFWGESGRHLTTEPTGILADMSPMFRLAFREYPLELAVLVLSGGVLVWLLRWAFRPAKINGGTRRSWWSYAWTLLLIAAITILGIRGSVRREPLRSSDAMLAGSETAGGLALNGWYSVLYSTFNKQRPPEHYMSDAEAARVTRSLLVAAGERFTSERYPFRRYNNPQHAITDSAARLNVVLIVVESLNASYLESFGGSRTVMPFLDSLARQSLIFTNCSAFGTRSFRGLCAIVASIPNLGPNPYAITLTLPHLRGLGDVLREQGYRVRFMHAAAPGSMGVQAICNMAGYDDFVTARAFPHSQHNGSWGVWDHAALQKMSQDMDSLHEPFHYGLFTLCTHSPWTLPEDFAPPFVSNIPGAERLNTFAYFDQALRVFFAREAATERFTRTLYVIIGDHTSHAEKDELFRVACIFFAPGRLAPEARDYPVGQLDVMPTILDLCGIQTEQAAFGRSMLDPDTAARFVVTDQSNIYGWRRGAWQLTCDADRLLALQNLDESPAARRNQLSSRPLLADSLACEFRAFYQSAETALRENRVSE